MPSVSGWRSQSNGHGGAYNGASAFLCPRYRAGVHRGSPYSGHLNWTDRALRERSVGRCLPKPGFGRVKVRKRRLTCLRALLGFEATTSALASTSCQKPDAELCSPRMILCHFDTVLLRR